MNRTAVSLAAWLALSTFALSAQAQTTLTPADTAELSQKVDKLSAELAALKARLAQSPSTGGSEPATVLTSYGTCLVAGACGASEAPETLRSWIGNSHAAVGAIAAALLAWHRRVMRP